MRSTSMKTAGLIGIAPPSTMDYYRSIVSQYRERTQDGSYPPLLINCIDMQKMLALAEAGRLGELAAFLGEEIEKLAAGGAHFGGLTANTAHLVFDELRAAASIPLISIVE